MNRIIGTEISIREYWNLIKDQLMKIKKTEKKDRRKYVGTYIVRSSK